VSLLIECKRSEMPYIFFASDSRPGRGGFAVSVAGLHQDEISVRTDDDMSTWSFTTLRALGLADHTFVADPPRVAMTFSKAARRGKELELSGTDPYQSLVLPLTKALRGYTGRIAPPKTAMYFDLVLPLAVAVIDGPMVVASVAQSGVSYELHPWVRVYRHDVDMAAARRFEREKLHAIDCVHSDWLEEYLLQHLNPFAEEFGRRSLVHDHEIATGSAFAEGMNRDSWSDLHHRLRPVRFSDRSRRPKTVIEGLRSAAEEAWPGRRRS
jgi:hypothetical protein